MKKKKFKPNLPDQRRRIATKPDLSGIQINPTKEDVYSRSGYGENSIENDISKKKPRPTNRPLSSSERKS